jgi:hypothetical protein
MKIKVHLIIIPLLICIHSIAFTREPSDRSVEKDQGAGKQVERSEIIEDAEAEFHGFADDSVKAELKRITSDELRARLAEKAGGDSVHIMMPQNYPNPFNSSTAIKYSLPVEAYVYIAVYNIFGQKVKIIKDEIDYPGDYEVYWNGRDEGDAPLSSGVYFFIFAADNYYTVGKMLHLK